MIRIGVPACAMGLGLLLSACGSVPPSLEVAELGSFHIGGRSVRLENLPARELISSPGAPPIRVDPNGDFEVEQMYVRYTRLAHPAHPYPMLMWHGGGFTGVVWETKPDHAAGWEMWFLRAGYDVYVSDAVERGRASWAKYPEIFTSEPFFRTKKEAWELFRVGGTGSWSADPASRRSWPGSRFPVSAFDQMMKQSVPRWSTNDAATQKAYDALVDKICPCVIVVHSQGANFAFTAALRAPGKVKAIVALEPAGSPDPAKSELAALKNTPILWVWGDYTDRYEPWKALRARQDAFRASAKAAGVRADLLDLPAIGVHGNTHLLMMDGNSDRVAGLVDQWLAGATKP